MKNSILKKMMFCLVVAIGILSLGSVSAEPLLMFGDTGLSTIVECGGATLAMAAVAIPAYDLNNLTCLTREQFEGLRTKYGRLYIIDVVIDEDEKYQFVVRRLSRDVQNQIEKYANDPNKVSDLVIKNLVVAGNENNALDDGVVFKQFSQAIIPIISAGQSFFGKA
jgi:hypothetical protein